MERQRKPVHTVHQGSVLLTADQRQATTSFPTCGRAGNRTPASEVGGESVTTLPPWPFVLHENTKYYPVSSVYLHKSVCWEGQG